MGDLTSVASPENGTSMVVIYGRFASTLSFFTILTSTSGLGTFTISVGSIQSWTMQPKLRDVESAMRRGWERLTLHIAMKAESLSATRIP